MTKFIVDGVEVDANGKPTSQKDASTETADTSALDARIQELEGQVQNLTAERDAAQKAVQDNNVLPAREQAITIISSVKRVSDEMAAEIYTALTAPAQPAQD